MRPPRCTHMLFRTAVAAIALVAVLTPIASAPTLAQPGDDSVALAEVMLTRLNEARHDSGLAPYRTHPILTRIAFDHARDIAAKTMYSHTGSDGRKPKQRAIDAGYGAGRGGLRIGENFVARQHLDDGFQWLMDDPPHRANMLDPNYREVGVGAARMSYGYVWVIDLGTYDGIDSAPAAPPTAPPAPSEPPTPVPTETPAPPPTETPTEPPTATLAATVAPPTVAATGDSAATIAPDAATEVSAAPDATASAGGPDGGGGESGSATGSGASSRWLWPGLLVLLVLLGGGWYLRRRG